MEKDKKVESLSKEGKKLLELELKSILEKIETNLIPKEKIEKKQGEEDEGSES